MCCRRLLHLLVGTTLAVVSLLYPEVAAADHQRPCPPDRPLDLPIAYGDIIDPCEINPPADIHFYQFAGLEGEIARIRLTGRGGPGVPCMTVLYEDDPEPVVRRSCAFGFPAHIEIQLTRPGTYKIRVDESSFSRTTSYGLYLNLPPSPIERMFSPNFHRSRLLHEEDVDLYFFALDPSPADLVILQLNGISGPGVPCISLFDPNGVRLAGPGCAFGGPVRIECPGMGCPRLTIPGAYTVRIETDLFSRGTPTYDLVVNCSGPCSRSPGFPGFPTVTLTLTGCTSCGAGDVFSARMFLNNPAPNSGELKLTYISPDLSLASIGDPHREVPPDTRIEDEEIVNEPITPDHPPGMWRVCGQLIELRRGHMLGANCQTFEIRPQ